MPGDGYLSFSYYWLINVCSISQEIYSGKRKPLHTVIQANTQTNGTICRIPLKKEEGLVKSENVKCQLQKAQKIEEAPWSLGRGATILIRYHPRGILSEQWEINLCLKYPLQILPYVHIQAPTLPQSWQRVNHICITPETKHFFVVLRSLGNGLLYSLDVF